jgi:hypothetical protein
MVGLAAQRLSFMQIKEKYGTLRVYWNFAEIENYDEIKSRLKKPDELDECINKYPITRLKMH